MRVCQFRHDGNVPGNPVFWKDDYLYFTGVLRSVKPPRQDAANRRRC